MIDHHQLNSILQQASPEELQELADYSNQGKNKYQIIENYAWFYFQKVIMLMTPEEQLSLFEAFKSACMADYFMDDMRYKDWYAESDKILAWAELMGCWSYIACEHYRTGQKAIARKLILGLQLLMDEVEGGDVIYYHDDATELIAFDQDFNEITASIEQ